MNIRYPIIIIIITIAESFAQLIAASQYRQCSETDLRFILQTTREVFDLTKLDYRVLTQ